MFYVCNVGLYLNGFSHMEVDISSKQEDGFFTVDFIWWGSLTLVLSLNKIIIFNCTAVTTEACANKGV